MVKSGRPAFWPSNNMKTACGNGMTARGLVKTWTERRKWRLDYQNRVERGEFKGPTVAEMQEAGKELIMGYDKPGEWWDFEDVNVPGKKRIIGSYPKGYNQRPIQGNTPKRMTKTKRLQTVDEDRPEMTNKHWSGDFFDWYVYFIQPDFPNPKPMGDIHRRWADELDADDLVIMVKPRDHFKTTYLSIGYALYNICERLLYPVMIVSLAEMNTKKVYGAIKNHLENNPRILKFYGYLIDDERSSTQKALYLRYQPAGIIDPGLFCTTFGGNVIMGTHPKLAMLDDIQNKPLTPALMRSAIQLVDASLIPAMGVDGKLVIIGTIKGYSADNDIYIYCRDKGDGEVFSYFPDPSVYLVDIDGNPLYDDKGQMLYDMPPMKDVRWNKVRIQRTDAFGTPLYFKAGKKKGQPRMRSFIDVKIMKDSWRYRTIFPEVYSIEDIIRKRIILRKKNRNTDDIFWSEYFLKPCAPTGNFLSTERIGGILPSTFLTLHEFMEWQENEGIYTVVSVDPGGKKSHGIAITVQNRIDGHTYIYEIIVHRGGLPEVAITIAHLLIDWNVAVWGVEGNFDQTEVYGKTLDREVYRYMKEHNLMSDYRTVMDFKSTGEKHMRIKGTLSKIVGPKDMQIIFHVNKNAQNYEKFHDEYITFGSPETASLSFDILDAICNGDIHLADYTAEFFWISNESEAYM